MEHDGPNQAQDSCPLCWNVHKGPEDDQGRPQVTISPVYDPAMHRQLVETEHPSKLFGGGLLKPPPSGQYRIYGDIPAGQAPSSAEEMTDLQAEARSRAWREAGSPWLDITVWAHMSVTLLYIGYLSAAEKARQAGNTESALSHDKNAAAVRAAVVKGNAAAMNYLRQEAAYARLSDYRNFSDRDKYELGLWEDTHEWVMGVSVQLLDRDTGNPRLHAHNLVLNLMRRPQPSGEWGRLDLRGLERELYVPAMYGRLAIEQAMSRSLGVAWVKRADRNGHEIDGISEQTMQAFSAPSRAAPSATPRQSAAPARPAIPLSLKDEFTVMGLLSNSAPPPAPAPAQLSRPGATPDAKPPWQPGCQAVGNEPKLTIEIIPTSLHGQNPRTHFGRTWWDATRKAAYAAAGYRCEICGGHGQKHPVELHERYSYDEHARPPIQRITGLIVLCPACHAVKHLYRTSAVADENNDPAIINDALRHLQKVNDWTVHQLDRYLHQVRRTYARREALGPWIADYTALT
jgi:hypothetical protein